MSQLIVPGGGIVNTPRIVLLQEPVGGTTLMYSTGATPYFYDYTTQGLMLFEFIQSEFSGKHGYAEYTVYNGYSGSVNIYATLYDKTLGQYLEPIANAKQYTVPQSNQWQCATNQFALTDGHVYLPAIWVSNVNTSLVTLESADLAIIP